MAECSITNLYKSLPWCAGKTTAPGIRKRVYFIPKRFIAKWPTLPEEADPKTPGGLVTYNGSFTLTADNYWQYIDVVQKSSKVTSESQGEQGSKTHLCKGTFFYPGTEAEIEEFCTEANNDDIVFLFETQKGEFKVLGCPEYESNITSSGDTGSSPTDATGETINVEVTQPTKPCVYKGAILIGADEDANASD